MDKTEQMFRYFFVFLENASFFYIIFRKDFRRLSKLSVLGIVLCCIAVFVGMKLGLRLEGNTTPFLRVLFIIFIL